MIFIALADDNNLFRNALSHYLKNQNTLKVLFDTCNGQDLISELKTSKLFPDIILMDINMPVMDGKEATKIIKILYPSIKIIVLSFFHHDHLIKNMLSLGVNGYLSKNADPEILKEAIYVVKDGNYYIENGHGKFVVFNSLPKKYTTDCSNSTSAITHRQKLFLQLCAEGKSYNTIADQMSISEKIANNYREQLCVRFNKTSRSELVHYAIQNGLVDIFNSKR